MKNICGILQSLSKYSQLIKIKHFQSPEKVIGARNNLLPLTGYQKNFKHFLEFSFSLHYLGKNSSTNIPLQFFITERWLFGTLNKSSESYVIHVSYKKPKIRNFHIFLQEL